jgi:hypothetical protein
MVQRSIINNFGGYKMFLERVNGSKNCNVVFIIIYFKFFWEKTKEHQSPDSM